MAQGSITPKRIDSLLKKSKNGKGKIISNYDTLPRASFRFNKKTGELFLIDLLYPWDKVMVFHILNNQLVKLGINKMDEQRKRTYWSWYYFDNGSLIYKDENYIQPQDVTALKKIFEEYRAKAEAVKR
jgi:hypothetical protein